MRNAYDPRPGSTHAAEHTATATPSDRSCLSSTTEFHPSEAFVFGPREQIAFDAFVEDLTLLDGAPFVLASWQRDFIEREFNGVLAEGA